jgi:hypothetical protein
MSWVLIALGILSTFGPASGSIEGMIYTPVPIRYQLRGWLEVLPQVLLLSGLLSYQKKMAELGTRSSFFLRDGHADTRFADAQQVNGDLLCRCPKRINEVQSAHSSFMQLYLLRSARTRTQEGIYLLRCCGVSLV